ncbi:MAG TPA: carboxypeptidase-like regulatory domain-containing protein [Saprospiraceae bacterium]|nr:carboxypeptidase-like regulatory domain-containing protein [Saprospiraceae bacterium]HQW55826.1 carboxypeptidase-like regulatory domain-containing protein [Saprospiraceae bacterium]
MRYSILIFFLWCSFALSVSGQSRYSGPIQLSGIVVTDENNQPVKLPYVNIGVKGTSRGTFSNWDGFFSLVVEKGETIVFSFVGFKPVEYVIPDTLTTNRYTIVQIMYQDNIYLPETIIYPWPSKDNYRVEFLTMDVNSDILNRAQQNLDKSVLASLYDKIPVDGKESSSQYFRQNAATYYYAGQVKPQNILNLFAWQQFIDAWKKGKFKKRTRVE